MSRALVGICLLASVGCIDTDAAVFVEPTIEGPTARVQTSSLSTAVEGSLTLRLHLGSRASGDSQVTVRQFAILDASGNQEIAPLVVATAPPSPITVVRGGDDSIVSVTFSADDNLLDTAAVDALCAPAGVVIRGTIDDALLGATTPATSEVFSVAGCP